MTMFGSRKRHRKPYTPPTAATVNPNAATAAVSAYNLSSAAAAAALRNLPTAPTNVAAVQTKRTQRRSASLSAEGTRRPLSPVPSLRRVMGLGGTGNGGELPGRVASPIGVRTLRRRGSTSSMRSVSSMSERTFRSPSPHQNKGMSSLGSGIPSSRNPMLSAAGAAAVAAAAGTSSAAARHRSMPPPPPVPPIPQNVIDEHEQASAKLKKSRRTTSLGFVQQPLRLASEQQKSQASNRASWFASGGVGNVADIRTSDAPMDSNRPLSPTERPGSRSSLHNFSYPSRQRLSSPPASPTHSRHASTSEPTKATGAAGAIGAAGAALAAALTVRKTARVRSVSTERDNKPLGTAKQSGAAASRRSASTSRVAGHPRGTAPSDTELVYDANSRRMVPRGELLLREQPIHEAPAKQPHAQQHTPRHLHKKKQPLRTQPTHPAPPAAAEAAVAEAAVAEPAVAEPAVAEPAVAEPAVAVSPSSSQPPEPRAAEPTEEPVLAPTVEEPVVDKIDEEAAQPVPALSTSTSTPASSVSSLPALAASQPESQPASPATSQVSAPVAIERQPSPVDEMADDDAAFVTEDSRPALVKRPSVVHEVPELEEEEERRSRSPAPAEGKSARSKSRSPVRVAHFSPVVADTLTVHNPPARSISPRKSALKHANSPRDASPSDSTSDAATVSYQSSTNTTEVAKRKKANRVSFDEKAVVLTGPPPASSVQKPSTTPSLPGAVEASLDGHTVQPSAARSRSWFSNIGRNKKKKANDLGTDDDDVIMKPRPALPSFGSVRDKPSSTARPEERALVKPGSDSQPSTRQAAAAVSSPPPSALKATETSSAGISGEHIVNGSAVMSSASTTAPTEARHTANTSRYREPLPPVVTSVDGSGYVSDSDASTSSEDEDYNVQDVVAEDDEEHSPVLRFDEAQDTTVPAPISSALAATGTAAPSGAFAPAQPEKVPAISISHPSLENLGQIGCADSDHEDGGAALDNHCPAAATPACDRPAVPGSFPDSCSDNTASKKSSPTQSGLDHVTVPVRQNAFEPITQDDDHTYSSQMPATVFVTHMPTVHEDAPLSLAAPDDDSSESEVFSDAYEDLSDIEGDGFLSLDAVLDGPTPAMLAKSPLVASLSTDSSSSSQPKSTSASSAFVGGTSISMSALMASAASQNGDMGTLNPEDKDDWAKAKAFWRGLTEERRLQLEKEAKEDAAADGDLEEESVAAKKPRQKKSVEARLAEKRAVLESSSANVAQVTEDDGAGAGAEPERKPEAAASTSIATTTTTTPTRMRRSMRGGLEEKETPAVLRSKAQHARVVSLDSASTGRPSTLRRRASDSSESSFQRPRAGPSGFRKSMRAEPGPTAVDTEAITLANTMANENLTRRGSRFSLRSLSPAGSTTLRGSAESSPHFRRTLRDSEAKRVSSPGPMANATLRSKKAEPSGSGFLSSLGKKSGGKHLQRSRNLSGGGGGGGGGLSFSRSRHDDSSDDDNDDVFGPSSGLGGAGAGGEYTFRSRFADSSDEDEVIPEHRTVRPQGKDHVVPKTLRSYGTSSTSGTSGRPGTAPSPRAFSVPEKLLEADEGGSAKRPQSARLASKPFGGQPAAGGNIGTSTLRRPRSGRGQMPPLPPLGNFSTATSTTGAAPGVGGAAPAPVRQRRASSIMSVLRRKKTESVGSVDVSGGIGRGEMVDSAARRDTQLERNARELAAVRNPGAGGTGTGTGIGIGIGSTPRIMPHDGDDSDLDDEDGAGAGANNSWPLRGSGNAAVNPDLYPDNAFLQQKKKKFPALRRMFRLKN